MPNIALIRVSDAAKQSNTGQRDRISRYAEKNRLIVDRWVEIEVSASKTTAEERGWYQLIEELSDGDGIITVDVARISRDHDAGEIIFAIQSALRAKITLHFVDTGQVLLPGDLSDPGKLFMTVAESYVASRFSRERSIKAKAAANRRRRLGLRNGRPHGYLVKSKLDPHEDRIVRALNDGVAKAVLARELGVSRTTLVNWIKTRDKIRRLAIEKFGASPSSPLGELKQILNRQHKKAPDESGAVIYN